MFLTKPQITNNKSQNDEVKSEFINKLFKALVRKFIIDMDSVDLHG